MKAAPRDMLCYYAGHNFGTGMATISASVGYLRGLSEPWDTIGPQTALHTFGTHILLF